VDGDPCWPSVKDLPEKPTIVVFVVPARVGLRVLEDCAEAGLRNIWIQPGAFSPELRAALDDSSFDWVAEACVMVRARVAAV
jgi:predicted CoA-binding protein